MNNDSVFKNLFNLAIKPFGRQEENMFFIAVDLATHAIEIGQIELPEEEDEAVPDNGPVTLH